MARTNAYMSKIQNKIAYVNKKIRAIENKFGVGSEQLDRYINVATAALPTDAYNLSESGKLRIKNTKAVRESVKLGQVNALTKLPTAAHTMQMVKLEIAKNNYAIEGKTDPTAEELKEAAVSISDQQALQELDDKSYVRSRENAKGRLHYTENERAALSAKGKKSYGQLRKILEEGESKKRAKHAEAQRRYYQAHKAEISERRKAQRAAKRTGSF